MIPEECPKQLLAELHEGHFGITKLKARARSCTWWPGIDTAMVKSCPSCQENRNAPPEAPIHPWPWPSRLWS